MLGTQPASLGRCVAGDISTAKRWHAPIFREAVAPGDGGRRGIMCNDQNDRAQQVGVLLTRQVHYPRAMPVSTVSPNIIMLMIQSRPFISTMNPSYIGLTFEKLVIVNVIRRDTFILLSVIRLMKIRKTYILQTIVLYK